MRKKLPIFYSAILLTSVNLVLRFVGTSFQVYLSGRIGASGIGLLQLVMSVGALSVTAAMAGVKTASMYLTAEELGHKRYGNVHWILKSCGCYSLICSCFVGIILYHLSSFLANYWIGNSSTVPALQLFAILLPVNCLCGVMIGYFTAANRIAALSAVEIGEQLCSMVTTVFLLKAWAGKETTFACMAVIAGSGVAAIFTLVALTILHLKECIKPGPRICVRPRLLKIALPLALADDLKAGISTTENLMVPRRLALYHAAVDPLAAFGVVSGMVFPVMMFPAAIIYALAELLLPELARCAAISSQIRIRYLVRRSLRVALLYGCVFMGLMILLSNPICQVLYSNPEAAVQLRRFAVLIPMLYCDAITDAMTKGLGQQKACVRYNIATSFLDVLLLYSFLPRWGMAGYFVSFAITHALNFVLSIMRLFKIINFKPKLRTSICTMLACIFSITLAGLIRSAIVSAVSYILLFMSTLTLLNITGKEDIIWLKGLVIKK